MEGYRNSKINTVMILKINKVNRDGELVTIGRNSKIESVRFSYINGDGKRVIRDGEALAYECLDCGNKFERLIRYDCCYPEPEERKEILEKYPTICPACHSTNLKGGSKVSEDGIW